jgi:hypothetical protein
MQVVRGDADAVFFSKISPELKCGPMGSLLWTSEIPHVPEESSDIHQISRWAVGRMKAQNSIVHLEFSEEGLDSSAPDIFVSVNANKNNVTQTLLLKDKGAQVCHNTSAWVSVGLLHLPPMLCVNRRKARGRWLTRSVDLYKGRTAEWCCTDPDPCPSA